jgi:hypothetical protein
VWRTEQIRLDKTERGKAEAGAARLSELTNEEYRIASRGFLWKRRELGARVDNLLLVLVYAVGFKPPKYRMIGLVRDSDTVLIPSELAADLWAAGRLMGVSRSNLFWLYELIIWDYGFVRRGGYPRHLKSNAEAAEVGVLEDFEEARRLLPDGEIWWQKYGGMLYSFSADGERVAFYELGSLLGNFERKYLP